jgi:hypothetical protein
MTSIPYGPQVSKALRQSESAVKAALKTLNDRAAHLMSKGNYEEAAALAETGRQVQEFQETLWGLRSRWEAVRRKGRGIKQPTTPKEAYDGPILAALIERGGEATRSDIDPMVERFMRPSFKAGDSDKLGRGKQRWQVMVQRCLRNLARRGLVSKSGHTWKITSDGRRMVTPQ